MSKPFKGLKLNLQLFADDLPPTNNEPQNNPSGGTNPEVEPPKTFTQEEVNAIASKESKKAQEKFLKSLGFEDFNNAKEGLAKLKEWQDSQKTESEKQADLIKQNQDNITKYQLENESLKAQLSASKLGIKEESINDVVLLAKTLVNEDTDLNQAMSKVLEKYPHFKGEGQTQEPPNKPTFTKGNHKQDPVPPENIFAKAWGLKQ